jgi:alpha-methylacyl-CoA racemase
LGSGPLAGIRVLELVGLGPGPMCGMVLADLGADVLRIDRLTPTISLDSGGTLERSKRSAAIDLKSADGVAVFLDLVEQADVLIDVFRPGVTERLGFGPADCLARNPRLIYGRLTGWGQEGPLAKTAGHDIDYIAIAGALEPLGRADGPPTPPINVLGDFAGGGLLLALGICAALVDVSRSGRGQVVDAAMIDGAAMVMAPFYAGRAKGTWGPRGTNYIDTGAPWYDVYETADHKWIAVGAIEKQFYAAFVERIGLTEDPDLAEQWDRSRWPAARKQIAAAFKSKTRDEWAGIYDGTDACVAPVLEPTEASEHPHNKARGTFTTVGGVVQPRPSPRFDGTPLDDPQPMRTTAETADALSSWGIDSNRITALAAAGVISTASQTPGD